MEREQYERYRALLRALSKEKAKKRGKKFKITDSKGMFIIFTYPKSKRYQLNTAIIQQLDKLKTKKNAQLDFINSLDIIEVRPKPSVPKKAGNNKHGGRPYKAGNPKVVIKHKDGNTPYSPSPYIAKRTVKKVVRKKVVMKDISKTADEQSKKIENMQ